MHTTTRTAGALLALVLALALPAAGQALERPLSLSDLLGAELDGPARWSLQTRLAWDGVSQSASLSQAISLALPSTSWGPIQLTVGRLLEAGQVQPFFGVRLGEEGRRLQLDWSPAGWTGALSWQLAPGVSLRVRVLAGGGPQAEMARPWLCLRDC